MENESKKDTVVSSFGAPCDVPMGYFKLGPEILWELGMPDNCKFCGAQWNFVTQTLQVFIICPDLPVVNEGMPIPEVRPLITKEVVPGGFKKFEWSWDLRWPK